MMLEWPPETGRFQGNVGLGCVGTLRESCMCFLKLVKGIRGPIKFRIYSNIFSRSENKGKSIGGARKQLKNKDNKTKSNLE